MFQLINQPLEDWSKEYTGPKFHAVFCDPPYGLEFMGKEWDSFKKAPRRVAGTGGTQAPFAHHSVKLDALRNAKYQAQVTIWGEALLPHLYPGALVFMFGGSRTWHRLATGMEDAGFEMWDTLMWLYGTGFPKAQDISKLIDKKNGDKREVIGYDAERARPNRLYEGGAIGNLGGTGKQSDRTDNGATITAAGSDISAPWEGHKTCALKPAWEPILCFKAPTDGKTYAELALQCGSGTLNIDAARISHTLVDGGSLATNPQLRGTINGGNGGNIFPTETEQRVVEVNPLGRYPANLCLDNETAEMLDEQSGITKSSGGVNSGKLGKRIYGKFANETIGDNAGGLGDTGGASRFFYCPKAGSAERHAGVPDAPGEQFSHGDTLRKIENKAGKGNNHPTVKPIKLIEYFAKLILPAASVSPRRILVPFSGSGSEMIGCLQAGWDEVIGVEKDSKYCEIARYRLEYRKL